VSIPLTIDFADDDDAWIGDFLAVVAVEDGHVRAGRPVGYFPDFVRVRSFPVVACARRTRGQSIEMTHAVMSMTLR
jgi:hypothetical protein